jgi:hypothetical protein
VLFSSPGPQRYSLISMATFFLHAFIVNISYDAQNKEIEKGS